MLKRIIIGEGSYGCVHQPSIECNKDPSPGFNYDDYVSKIMKTKYAEQELSDFLIIHRADPSEKYHLGEPILCKPKLNEENLKDIKKCKQLTSFMDKTQNDFSLLLLKYGGYDIKDFCDKHLDKYFSSDKENKTNKLLLEIHHLLKGLRVFYNNEIVHYDIKPQNILINPKTGKMVFIDFGLMKKRNDIIDLSKDNKNPLAVFHWSYPLDTGFLNAKIFANYKNRNTARRNFWKKELAELIVIDSQVNTLDLPINKPDAFKIIFTYLNLEDKTPPNATQYGYIDSFFDGFNKMLVDKKKDEIIEKIINSIDVFGLGFTAQYLINALKRKDYIDTSCYTRLTSFFSKMYSYDPLLRVTDLDILIDEYENILLELGVLSALNVHFENNSVVTGIPAPTKLSTTSMTSVKPLSKELDKIADLDAIELEIDINCPENKEWHPIKKRCVKKCAHGYIRNIDFKCVKRSSDIQQSGGTKIPLRYVPHKLTKKDKLKQKNALQKSRKLYKKGKYFTRPKVTSFKSKPSKHILNAQKMYDIENISPSKELAEKTGCSINALRQIVKKGEGAYYSSGSRPNQTAQSWGYARLASAITSGKSAAVDYKILERGCKHKGKAFKLATKAKKKYGFGQGKTKKINL